MAEIAQVLALTPAVATAAILADASDALAGNGGWAGAGLLGLVLAWLLLKHLPAMFDRHDKQMSALAELHKEQMRSATDTFKESLKEVVEHCEAETKANAAVFRDEVAKLTNAVEKIQAGGPGRVGGPGERPGT